MKNNSWQTTAFLLFAALPSAVHSQSYLPMLEEGRTWQIEDNITSFSFITGEEIMYDVSLDGDTVINGHTWKRLVRDGSTYLFALREEGPRVWATDGQREQLFYDFSLNVGDEFDPYPPSSPICHLIVTKTDTVCVGGIPRRRLWLLQEWYYSAGFNSWSNIWVEGIGAYWGPFDPTDAIMGSGRSALLACREGENLLFSLSDFEAPAMHRCATPTIAYDNGRLVFSCETEGAECVYEVKCADEGSGRGSEVSLGQTYEIRVHATLDGHYDSDVATATIGWRNGRPVMEGFSSVTLGDGEGDGEGSGDVNGDGVVDVADISAVIAVMAGKPTE